MPLSAAPKPALAAGWNIIVLCMGMDVPSSAKHCGCWEVGRIPVFDSNCFYIIQCLVLVFVVAPCVLFAGGMLICGLMWCGLRITRAMHLRLLGLPRCGRCRYWATVQCPLYGRNTPSDFCSRGERWGD